MLQALDQEAKANVIAGYAASGAWLALLLHLCGLRGHVGMFDLSITLACVGAAVGAYRVKRIGRSVQ